MKSFNNNISKIGFLLIFFLLITTYFAYPQDWNSSNLFSSNKNLTINHIEKDNNGSTYVSGTFSDTLTLSNDSQYFSRGNTDIFLAKFDINFESVWFKQIGGDGTDFLSNFYIKNNIIYLIGSFMSTIKFNSSDSLVSKGGWDIFLSSFQGDGSLIWKKNIASGTSNQIASDIAVDHQDSILITGIYFTEIEFETENYTSSKATLETFYAKFDNNGNYSWVKRLPSTNNISRLTSITPFTDGYYFTGYFRDSLFTDIGIYLGSNSNTSDFFLYKSDNQGNGQWLRRGYGNGNELLGNITQDNFGNIYTTGISGSSFLEIDSTSSSKSQIGYNNNGGDDIFVSKFNKNGNLLWFKGYGGVGNDWAKGIIQKNNFLYVTGYFSDTIVFYQDTLKAASTADRDPYFGTYDLDGNPIQFVHLDGEGVYDDQGFEIAVSDNNIATIVGDFQSPTLQVGNTQLTNPNFESVFLADYTPPYSAVFTTTQRPSCAESTDGRLEVTPYFGVPPYTYTWSHAPHAGINDSIATGLSSGSYTVTVTDSRDSVAIASINLNAPAPIAINRTLTDVSCNNGANGAIGITVSGGTTPYSYAWSTTDGAGVNATGKDQTGLAAGTYTVSVTDNNGCSTDSSFTIAQPDPITFAGTIVTNASASASDGAINLSVSGGTPTYTYMWSTGATTQDLTNVPGDNYTVTVTDANGCVQDTSIVVQDVDQVIAYIASKTNVDCSGNSTGAATGAATGATGNLSYEWINASAVTIGTGSGISGLAAGNYTLEITDDGSLQTSSVSFTITEPNELTSTASPIDVECFGKSTGAINLSAAGGTLPYTYLWDNNATTEDLTKAPVGTYSVTVTDDNGCTTGTSATIDQPSAIAVSTNIDQSIFCFGETGTITASASGGTGTISFQWNDPGKQNTATASLLPARLYTVTATDDNGCQSSSDVTLTQPDPISFNTSLTHVACNGGNNGVIQLTVSGGTPTFDFFWSTTDGSGISDPLSRNQSGLSAGTYMVEATDGNLCSETASYTINEPPALGLSVLSQTDPLCTDESTGSIEVSATGGSGNYEYSIDGTNWVTSPLFENLAAGTYNIEVRDQNATTCVYSGLSPVDLTNPAPVVITSYASTYVSTAGASDGTVDVTASGGTGTLTYTLNGNSQATGAFTGLAVGSYTLSITDDNSCAKDTIISIEEELIALVENITDVDCAGAANGAASGNASGAVGTLSFNWMDETFTSVGTGANISGLAAGNYYLEVTDATTQQIDTTAFSITAPEPLVLTLLSQSDPLCADEATGSIEVTATGGSGSYEYSIDGTNWVTSPLFENLAAGTYNIEVREAGNTSCTSVLSPAVELVAPTPITVSSNNTVDASSETANDGAVNIEATGGTGTLTYALDGNQQDNGAFSGLTPGSYTMDITDENGCTITEGFTISFTSSVISYLEGNEIKVFPNPSQGIFSLTIENPETRNYEIEILDISGKLVYQKSFNIDFGKEAVTLEISIPGAQKGAYILRINDFAIPNRLVVE